MSNVTPEPAPKPLYDESIYACPIDPYDLLHCEACE
jgi:hypothetical protein